MFKYFICLITLFLGNICEATEFNQLPSILIINSKNGEVNQGDLARNFRSTSDSYKRKTGDPLPSIKGLKELNILGSAQFSEQNLKKVLRHLNHPDHFFIVDLRQEWHGFLNGIPVSWYGVRNASNRGKSWSRIMSEEKIVLEELVERKDIVLSKIVSKDKHGLELPEASSMPFTANYFVTEEALSAKYGFGYIRIPVRDALIPARDMVDRFLAFVKTLPKNSWLYFHCAAGVGRTTSFMIMYDIIKNANQVSFEDILKRQYLLGGSDLSRYGSESSWKYPFAIERHRFLKDFYEYVRCDKDSDETSWSQYVVKNNLQY